jgi:hypothetical protein
MVELHVGRLVCIIFPTYLVATLFQIVLILKSSSCNLYIESYPGLIEGSKKGGAISVFRSWCSQCHVPPYYGPKEESNAIKIALLQVGFAWFKADTEAFEG